MKRLMIVLAVLAIAVSFLPKAYAGESATLGLQVIFDSPFNVWSEPVGPFTVTAGETIEFKVIAEDRDALNVLLGAEDLPVGAEFIMEPAQPIDSTRREGTFRWTARRMPGLPDPTRPFPYLARFVAESHTLEDHGGGRTSDRIEVKQFVVTINVIPRIISIELNEANWNLQGVRLNELRDNIDPSTGQPIHRIINTGNVSVMVDIGYAPILIPEQEIGPGGEIIPHPLILPGLEQGLDRYITRVGETIIPPPQNYFDYANYPRIRLDRPIEPDTAEPLPLTYGAPTALSEGVEGMSVSYEIRAFESVQN